MTIKPSTAPTVVRHRKSGFTLPEVIVAFMVSLMLIGGIVLGYVQTTRNAEWSAYSLAAQSLAMQRLEMARSAKWDTASPTNVVDQLVTTNFPAQVNILDIPVTAQNQNTGRLLATNFPCSVSTFAALVSSIAAANVTFVYATNTTTISTISSNPTVKSIRVDCVWPFRNNQLFTNTVVTYRAPDA